jgi:hypothetical protein
LCKRLRNFRMTIKLTLMFYYVKELPDALQIITYKHLFFLQQPL